MGERNCTDGEAPSAEDEAYIGGKRAVDLLFVLGCSDSMGISTTTSSCSNNEQEIDNEGGRRGEFRPSLGAAPPSLNPNPEPLKHKKMMKKIRKLPMVVAPWRLGSQAEGQITLPLNFFHRFGLIEVLYLCNAFIIFML